MMIHASWQWPCPSASIIHMQGLLLYRTPCVRVPGEPPPVIALVGGLRAHTVDWLAGWLAKTCSYIDYIQQASSPSVLICWVVRAWMAQVMCTLPSAPARMSMSPGCCCCIC